MQLLKAFDGRYRHTVLALNGCYDMAAQLPPTAPLKCCGSTVANSPTGWRSIRRFIGSAKPDVLITYNWGAIEWAMANRFNPLARHIHIEDGFGSEERHRQLVRRVWFRRLALGGAHTLVVLPSRTLLDIATRQWRLRESSLRYLVNGIDCARFAPVTKSGGPIVIGTVAALRREKNLARLIRAFAAAAQARADADLSLVLVGDGPEREALEVVAKDTGCAGRITFAGATATPETYYAQMDIFAMSSDTEQMPLGVLEAMASGLPVVATDVGDIAGMVTPENRSFLTALSEEEKGLSRSLIALAGDPALRERLGRLNRQKALAEFDYRVMAEKYLQLFG